jgi:hypothetical protein
MRLLISLLALGFGFIACGASLAQESAGRVLAATGSVAIERGAQRFPAQAGMQVSSGDTFHLGPQSNAQIRFTDDSVVALGSDTSFQVSEYAFEGRAAEAQRAFFNLIKGGMRTVTGLIGRSNKASYGMRTLIATIGIRGTAYAACQDCTSVTGEVVPGTTVGFSEGSGSISTAAGELQLATGESAYAANQNALPVRIPVLPQTLQQASVRPRQQSQQAQAAPRESAPAPAATAAVAAVPDAGAALLSASAVTPVFQVTSTPDAGAVLGSSFTGTTFYRLAGPFNLPASCSFPPCGSAVEGEFILGINFGAQRATASMAVRSSTGDVLNLSIPISLGGVPISINGNQVTFSGTFNRADFPLNTGAFMCNNCGPNETPGPVDGFTVSATVNGSQALLTFSGDGPDKVSVTATLTQEIPPNSAAAAIATPALNGGGDARSASYWNVKLDPSGRLLGFGPPVGGVAAAAGGANNAIAGSAPAAGNLVWGSWTNGSTSDAKATITDRDYATFQPNSGSVQPWITGEASSALPPSLGVLTFNPIGSILSPNASLNSAKLTADFVNQSLQFSINASVLAGTAGTNTYQMNASTGFSPTTNRFSSGFNSVTCSGPCNSGVASANGAFAGFFAGPQAQGAGVAFTTGFGASRVGVAGSGVQGAIAFGR